MIKCKFNKYCDRDNVALCLTLTTPFTFSLTEINKKRLDIVENQRSRKKPNKEERRDGGKG